MEVRIYFECLEQAAHFISPAVEAGVEASGATDVLVRLVRKPDVSRLTSPQLAAIFGLTSPDILLTVCDDRIEAPVLLIEFSEAVFTEDHELQRSIPGIAAMLAGIPFLKVSGHKEAPLQHGGNRDFNPLTIARALRETRNYCGYYYADWPTAPGNSTRLRRHGGYLACPADGAVPLAGAVVSVAVATAVSRFDELVAGTLQLVEEVDAGVAGTPEGVDYIERLGQAPGVADMRSDWANRRPGRDGLTRLWYTPADGAVYVKIYRFSHAADPDRGILIFASSAVASGRVTALYSTDACGGLCSPEQLRGAFIRRAREEGIGQPILDGLNAELRAQGGPSVDLTGHLRATIGVWRSNRVISSIVSFADELRTYCRRCGRLIAMKWDRREVLAPGAPTLMDAVSSGYGFGPLASPQVLEEAIHPNEDEVTYVLAHKVLRPNAFRLVSVSYPGAQGDARFLLPTESGRTRTRQYVDLIARLPSPRESDITLAEAKESADPGPLTADVHRLKQFRDEPAHRAALEAGLELLDPGLEAPRTVLLGVAFGSPAGSRTTWTPAEIDYLLVLVGRNSWRLGTFGRETAGLFSADRGATDLPAVWRVAAGP